MSTDNTKTDFLRFSAYSMKELLTRKLSEDTKFTDMIYEGSNIAILIDLVSYMYQCLIYQLNNAASESMFSDTQIYENISRLVKMIGYNPMGIQTSIGSFYFDNKNTVGDHAGEGGKFGDNIILPFSYIDTGKTDSDGNSIYFSTVEQYTINSDENYEFKMYNGRWRLYSTVFTSSGSEYESFILNVGSDVENKKYVANNMIRIFVKSNDVIDTEWKVSREELYTNNDFSDTQYAYAQTLNGQSKIFNVRLNEDKNYEIKFGNGQLGKKLNKNDNIYVFYLETNGLGGQISPEDLNGAKLKHSKEDFGLNEDLYAKMFGGTDTISQSITLNAENPELYINTTTSTPVKEESVDDIRNSAPEEFKLGRRLVTKGDYEYYIKNTYRGIVIDVKCQNNFEYVAQSFFIWLYNLGLNGQRVQTTNEKLKRKSQSSYYLNEIDIVKYGFKYADPADANNIYLWTKLDNEQPVDNVQEEWKDRISDIKDLTHEVCFLEPINVQFSICAAPEERALVYLNSEYISQLIESENWIEITIQNNSIYVNSIIQSQVANIIKEFFAPTKQKLGSDVSYNDLLNQIYQINGIERIRTVYCSSEDNNEYKTTITRDGLSFLTWSSSYIDNGDDLEVTNSSRRMQDFQFPVLFDSDIEKKIRVIKKSMNNSNRIQY